MGIFSRLSDIINANLVTMLDKAEDPEKMIRLMISEMEETLVEVKSNAARIISDKKTMERSMSHLYGEVKEWQRRAELAVTRGRDDLAKLAIEEKVRCEETLRKSELDIQMLENSLDHLYEDIEKLEAKLADAHQRKKAIIARKQTLESQRNIRQALSRTTTLNMLDRFETWERSLDRLEGEAEVLRSRANPTTQEIFSKIENEGKVNEQLELIKQKVNGSFAEPKVDIPVDTKENKKV